MSTEEPKLAAEEPKPPAQEVQKVIVQGEPADYIKALRQEAGEWRTKYEEIEQRFNQLDKQQEQAKQKEMAEQGKYKELFDEATRQVSELEPLKGQVERYEGALAKMLEAQRQNVPEGIRALLDKLDPVDQLEWLAENAQPKQPEEPEKPAKLQPFSPVGGEAPAMSDRERISKLRQRLGQGGGLFG